MKTAFALVVVLSAAPPPVVVEADGAAGTVEEAKAVALRHAVEKAFAARPNASAAISNSVLAEERIFDRAADWVSTFEVRFAGEPRKLAAELTKLNPRLEVGRVAPGLVEAAAP